MYLAVIQILQNLFIITEGRKGVGDERGRYVDYFFQIIISFFQISSLFFVMQIAKRNDNGSRKDIISTESLENIPRRITPPITVYSLLSIITGLKMDRE